PARLVPGTTRLDVPVRARTSGAFTLDVRVTSPDGSIELDRSTFDIRSTAISGVGLVLSIGAGLFLLVWWARHWRPPPPSRPLMPPSAHPPAPVAPFAGADQDPGPARTPIPDHEYRPAHMAGHRSRFPASRPPSRATRPRPLPPLTPGPLGTGPSLRPAQPAPRAGDPMRPARACHMAGRRSRAGVARAIPLTPRSPTTRGGPGPRG